MLDVLEGRLASSGVTGLRYFTPETARAAFALPGYVKALAV